MQGAQQGFQHMQQRVARALRQRRLVAAEGGFGELQEPVAELVPGELVHGLRGEVEAVGLELRVDFREHPIQARQNPAFGIALR